MLQRAVAKVSDGGRLSQPQLDIIFHLFESRTNKGSFDPHAFVEASRSASLGHAIIRNPKT